MGNNLSPITWETRLQRFDKATLRAVLLVLYMVKPNGMHSTRKRRHDANAVQIADFTGSQVKW